MVLVSWSRILLGGLLAGLVINLFEFLFNGVILMKDWGEALRALNRSNEFSAPQVVAFNLWGFLMGIGAVWLYSDLRGHYGPGVRSALCAGLTVWALGYGFGVIPSVAMGIFPARLLVYSAAVGLVEICLGTMLGARVCKAREAGRPVLVS